MLWLKRKEQGKGEGGRSKAESLGCMMASRGACDAGTIMMKSYNTLQQSQFNRKHQRRLWYVTRIGLLSYSFVFVNEGVVSGIRQLQALPKVISHQSHTCSHEFRITAILV